MINLTKGGVTTSKLQDRPKIIISPDSCQISDGKRSDRRQLPIFVYLMEDKSAHNKDTHWLQNWKVMASS